MRGAPAGHVRRRRGSTRGRATVRAMADDPADVRPHAHPELDAGDEAAPPPAAEGELDLLTIGLVVFFVALIGTVVAMLILTIL